MFEMERIGPGVVAAGSMDRLPADLVSIEPGAELAGFLEAVDVNGLSGHDRVTLLRAWSRQLAHVQARFHASMASVSEAMAEEAKWADEEQVFDLSATEIGAALSWTRRAGEFNLGFAQDLVDRYPRVWEALDHGQIDLPRARVIIEQTRHLDPVTASQICDLALVHASGRTTGQLRARIQRLVIAVDPASARKRYAESVAGRRVISEANLSGTGNILGLDLPAAEVNAVIRRINRLARAARHRHDTRSMDQIRADIFLDLLNGGSQPKTGGTGSVEIRVDLTTLLELDDTPGEIPGWGPVIADIARQAVTEADHSQWRYTITDPETGQMIQNGVTRRRPNAILRRRIETLDPNCVFPRCPIPAGQCDLDHSQAWSQGGETTENNLQPLCRYHHRLKHNGWRVKRTRPGIYTWTSPLGHTYTTRPDPP